MCNRVPARETFTIARLVCGDSREVFFVEEEVEWRGLAKGCYWQSMVGDENVRAGIAAAAVVSREGCLGQ